MLRGNNKFYYYAEAAVQHDVIENTIFGYRWFTIYIFFQKRNLL